MVFHEAPPSEDALGFVSDRLLAYRAALARTDSAALLEGKVPSP